MGKIDTYSDYPVVCDVEFSDCKIQQSMNEDAVLDSFIMGQLKDSIVFADKVVHVSLQEINGTKCVHIRRATRGEVRMELRYIGDNEDGSDDEIIEEEVGDDEPYEER